MNFSTPDDQHGSSKPFFLRTSRALWGIGLSTNRLSLNRLKKMLKHVRGRDITRRNCLRRPSHFKVGDRVLVHHSRLPTWPRNTLQDPFIGAYRIIRINGSRILSQCKKKT